MQATKLRMTSHIYDIEVLEYPIPVYPCSWLHGLGMRLNLVYSSTGAGIVILLQGSGNGGGDFFFPLPCCQHTPIIEP